MGTELWVKRKAAGTVYHHSGVYVGKGRVIEVGAEPYEAARNLILGRAIVHVNNRSLKDFHGGAPVSIGPTRATRSGQEIAKLAWAQAGKAFKYDPLKRNCQHFTSDLLSGVARSPEAKAIARAFASLRAKIQRVVEKVVKKTKTVAKTVGKKARKGAKKAKKKLKKLF